MSKCSNINIINLFIYIFHPKENVSGFNLYNPPHCDPAVLCRLSGLHYPEFRGLKDKGEGGGALPAHTCRQFRDWRLKEGTDRKTQWEENVDNDWNCLILWPEPPDPDPPDPGSVWVHLDPGSTRDWLKISQLLPEAGSESRRSRSRQQPWWVYSDYFKLQKLWSWSWTWK